MGSDRFDRSDGLRGGLHPARLPALDTLPSQSWQYYALKLAAAFLVLGSLLGGDFNLASAVIQVFFVGVSLLGLGLHRGRKQRARACERSRAALHLDAFAGE